MDPQQEPIPLEYLRGIAHTLRDAGVDTERWLADGAVPTLELVRPGGTVPFAVFQRLLRGAIEASGEPATGLFAGQRIGPADHGIVGAAAVHSPSLRQGLEVVTRFSRLRTSLLSIRGEAQGEDARVVFDPLAALGDVERPALELAVVTVKTLLDEATLGRSGVREVCFRFADPGYGPLAQDVLACPVRYGAAWTGFVIPKEALDRPLWRTDQRAFAEASALCREELARGAPRRSWSARLRRMLLSHHELQRVPTLQLAARRLGVTPRTLHRRLRAEGTSYRTELDAVRHMLAHTYLRTPELGLQEIAFRLGYTDASNFRRAFKRWQGETPTAFRARA
ncbi:MAG: AraC family transcriptional regulator [Myxococcota bacterium]